MAKTEVTVKVSAKFAHAGINVVAYEKGKQLVEVSLAKELVAADFAEFSGKAPSDKKMRKNYENKGK